jgi:hypothetical protein
MDRRRSIVLGFSAAAALAVIGAMLWSMTAPHSQSSLINTGPGGSTTYLIVSDTDRFHHTHPMLAVVMWVGALVVAGLTLWRARLHWSIEES